MLYVDTWLTDKCIYLYAGTPLDSISFSNTKGRDWHASLLNTRSVSFFKTSGWNTLPSPPLLKLRRSHLLCTYLGCEIIKWTANYFRFMYILTLFYCNILHSTHLILIFRQMQEFAQSFECRICLLPLLSYHHSFHFFQQRNRIYRWEVAFPVTHYY